MKRYKGLNGKLVVLALALTLLASFLLPTLNTLPVNASTTVSGQITSDTVWTKASSPYIVTGNILVFQGVTLTIEPGVTVKFDSQKLIQIDGQLVAKGTQSEPIIFTSNQPSPAPGDWAGIQFTDTSVDAAYDGAGNYLSGSIMQYCRIQYGGYHYTPALNIENSSPLVERCDLNDNSCSAISVEGGSPKITNNNIIRNNLGSPGFYVGYYGGGIYISEATVTVSGNTISDNHARLAGGGIYVLNSVVTIYDNNIIANDINISGGTVSVIDNTITGTGVDIRYGTVTVSANAISNSLIGGICVVGGEVTISGNTLTNNWAPGDVGLFSARAGAITVWGGNVIVTRNSITSNSAGEASWVGGPRPGGIGIFRDYGTVVVNYNNIHSNTDYDLLNYCTQDIDARNNWWGTTDEATIEAHIYHWVDDSSRGLVTFKPYLTSPTLPTTLLSFTNLQPPSIATTASTYDAILTATGTNFNNIDRVTFTWSGLDSGTDIWDKGDSDWNSRVTINSDTSMTLRPRVLSNASGTQTQTWTWTVTLRDTTGATASQTFTVTYIPEQAKAGRVILIEPLNITPADPYFVGDTLTARFTVENVGNAAITLDKLLLGGRYDGWELSRGGFPDFTYQTVTLQPGGTHSYEGTFTALEPGSYRFFIAYHIGNPTPDEKKLLDENNWNTCTELGEGLTDTDRVKNVAVFQECEIPEELARLREAVDSGLNRHSQYRYPPYLLDTDSFTSAVATVWTDWTSFLTRTDLRGKYEELYYTGIEYQWLALKALLDADWFFNNGSAEGAREYLQRSYNYEKASAMSFTAAAEVFDDSLEAGAILAKGIMDGCEAAVSVGVVIVCPPAAAKVDAIYMGIDFVITTKIEGVDQATKDLIAELITKWILKDVKFTSLDDSTVETYVNRVSTTVSLDTLLANKMFMTEFGLELRKVITDRIIGELGVYVSEMLIEEIVKGVIDYLESLVNSVQVKAKSPVDLSVLDSKGQITGLMNKTVRHEIPMSLYYNGTIKVFFPADFYQYKVVGTSAGTYGLEIASIQGAEAVIFTATDIPTTLGAMHQYTIDWDALSRGEKGVNVRIDSDGDGSLEQSIESDAEFTSDEFAVAKVEAGLPFWIWVAIGIGVVAILGAVIGRHLVRRRA